MFIFIQLVTNTSNRDVSKMYTLTQIDSQIYPHWFNSQPSVKTP